MNPAVGLLAFVALAGLALGFGAREGERRQEQRMEEVETNRVTATEFVRVGSALHAWAQRPENRARVGDVPLGELRLSAGGDRYQAIVPWRAVLGPVTTPEGRRGWTAALVCDQACDDWLLERGIGGAELVNAALDQGDGYSGIGWANADGWLHNPRQATTRTIPLPAQAAALLGGRQRPAFAAMIIDPESDGRRYVGDFGGQTEVCYLRNPPACPDIRGRCRFLQAGVDSASDGSAACPAPDPFCPADFPNGDGRVYTRLADWANSPEAQDTRQWTFGPWYMQRYDCWRDDTEQASSGCGAGMNGSRTWERVVRRWADGRWGLRQDWRVVAESCSPCGVDEICDGGSDGPESSRCPDGSAIPAGGVCGEQPRCPDGSPRPASGVCPAMRRCPDGRLPPPSGICEESLPKTCPAGFRDVPESARYTSPWTSRPALATYSHCPSVQRREDIYGAENAWASAIAIRVVVPLTDLERYNPNLLVPGPQPALMRINPYEAAVACTRWGVERGYGDARCVSGAAIGQVTGGGFACFFDRFNEIQFHQDVNTAVFGDLSHWMQGSVGCVK